MALLKTWCIISTTVAYHSTPASSRTYLNNKTCLTDLSHLEGVQKNMYQPLRTMVNTKQPWIAYSTNCMLGPLFFKVVSFSALLCYTCPWGHKGTFPWCGIARKVLGASGGLYFVWWQVEWYRDWCYLWCPWDCDWWVMYNDIDARTNNPLQVWDRRLPTCPGGQNRVLSSSLDSGLAIGPCSVRNGFRLIWVIFENISVATVRFGTDFGPDRTIYLTGLDQTNTNRLKKSRSVYNWLLTGY